MSYPRNPFSNNEIKENLIELNFLKKPNLDESIAKINIKDKVGSSAEFKKIGEERLLTYLFLIKFFDDFTNSAIKCSELRAIVSVANKIIKVKTCILEFIDKVEYFDFGLTTANFYQYNIISNYVDIDALVQQAQQIVRSETCHIHITSDIIDTCVTSYKLIKKELEVFYNHLLVQNIHLPNLHFAASTHLHFFETFLANHSYEDAFLRTQYIREMAAEVRSLSEEESLPVLITHLKDIRSALFCARQVYCFATNENFNNESLSLIPEDLLKMSENIIVSESDSETGAALTIRLREHSGKSWEGPASLNFDALGNFYESDSTTVERLAKAMLQIKKILIAVAYLINLLENKRPLDNTNLLSLLYRYNEHLIPDIKAFGKKLAVDNAKASLPIMAKTIKQLDIDTQKFKDKHATLTTSITNLDKEIPLLETKLKDVKKLPNLTSPKNKKNKKSSKELLEDPVEKLVDTIALEIVSPFENQKSKLENADTIEMLDSIGKQLKKIQSSLKTINQRINSLITANAKASKAVKPIEKQPESDSECSSDESLQNSIESINLTSSTASPISTTRIERATSAPTQSNHTIKKMLGKAKQNLRASGSSGSTVSLDKISVVVKAPIVANSSTVAKAATLRKTAIVAKKPVVANTPQVVKNPVDIKAPEITKIAAVVETPQTAIRPDVIENPASVASVISTPKFFHPVNPKITRFFMDYNNASYDGSSSQEIQAMMEDHQEDLKANRFFNTDALVFKNNYDEVLDDHYEDLANNHYDAEGSSRTRFTYK